MKIRFILNTFYSGPQAWFFVADDRGYFRDEGLEVEFIEGDTLANAVPKLADGLFDAGYGDLNALVEWASARPDDAPVGVFAMHNRSPYTIAVSAQGSILRPKDLEGRTLVTHSNDAAWRMFPEFCTANEIDARDIGIEVSDLPHRAIVPKLLAGEWDGLFGFVNTINAQSIEAGVDPFRSLRHFEWRHHVPSLYGAAVMVTPALRRDHPDAVAALVRAINRGVIDTVADIDSAIDAVVRRNPSMDRVANHARLKGTIGLEMADAEGATIGIGAVDMSRLSTTIELMTRAKGLSNPPSAQRLFDSSFLPPLGQRVRSLNRG